jgi:hypothetical protein
MRNLGEDFFENLQPFAAEILEQSCRSCNISARLRQAGHEPSGHRIGRSRHDYRDSVCCFLGGTGRGISTWDNYINAKPDQIGCEIWEPFVSPFRPSIPDRNVLSLDVTEVTKSLPECLDEGIRG